LSLCTCDRRHALQLALIAASVCEFHSFVRIYDGNKNIVKDPNRLVKDEPENSRLVKNTRNDLREIKKGGISER
jgi:hypothetical protein